MKQRQPAFPASSTAFAAAGLALALLAGCAQTPVTSASNEPPQPVAVSGQEGTYRFRVDGGLSTGPDEALATLGPRLEAFRKARGYSGFTIVDRQRHLVDSYYEYTVKYIK